MVFLQVSIVVLKIIEEAQGVWKVFKPFLPGFGFPIKGIRSIGEFLSPLTVEWGNC